MTAMTSDACDAVLSFWFEEIEPRCWWQKDAGFDDQIRYRFGALHEQATRGELLYWRDSAEGRLAEVLVLDQFSRNIWRDQARAFAHDGMALVLAQEAVAAGVDQALPPERRAFLYMPYMHSESLAIHQLAMKLFEAPGLEDNLRFESAIATSSFGSVATRIATLFSGVRAQKKSWLSSSSQGRASSQPEPKR